MPSVNTVCVVVATYADRFGLLSQVIETVLAQGVEQVIVVDNGSLASSSDQISALSRSEPRVTVFRFDRNQGSAPAFRKGLELAQGTPHDWFWVLDDDNRPEPGALRALQDFWAGAAEERQPDQVALSSLRRDRPNFMAAITRRSPDLVLPPKNSFAGFHVGQLGAKLRERLSPPLVGSEPIPAAGKLSACAYGGLYCHRSLLARLGLPDPRYVLYMDDFFYTHAFVRQGGVIWLVRDSVVTDLEASFYLPRRKALLYHSVFDGRSDASVYYGVRNGVHFARQYLVTRWSLFRLNQWVFLVLLLGIGVLRRKWHRLRVLWQAVRDGNAGRMGLNPAYPL
jgi:GT2 family glycosyltransferase